MRCVLVGSVVVLMGLGGAAWAAPWADTVVRYSAGDATDYMQASAALGEPSRTTAGWPIEGPAVSVRMTEGPWLESQVVKVGIGGELVVSFSEPVENDPLNPWGIDLLVFTTMTFAGSDWPDLKIIDSSGFTFGGDLGKIFVSQDDVTWYRVASVGPQFPTQGYIGDAWDAYATGAALSDFTLPVNPGHSLADFAGLAVSQGVTMYAGSGGGLGIDLSNLVDGSENPVSLDWIRYVRVEGKTSAIDGFADVTAMPEPATVGLVAAGLAGLALRRRRR